MSAECVEKFSVPEEELKPEFRDYIPKGVTMKGTKIYGNASQSCQLMALSPMAFVIKLQERQCQNAAILRKKCRLEMIEKTKCELENLE